MVCERPIAPSGSILESQAFQNGWLLISYIGLKRAGMLNIPLDTAQ